MEDAALGEGKGPTPEETWNAAWDAEAVRAATLARLTFPNVRLGVIAYPIVGGFVAVFANRSEQAGTDTHSQEVADRISEALVKQGFRVLATNENDERNSWATIAWLPQPPKPSGHLEPAFSAAFEVWMNLCDFAHADAATIEMLVREELAAREAANTGFGLLLPSEN